MQIKVHFENHPNFDARSSSIPPDENSLEYKLFVALAEANLLVGPGTMFAADNAVQERSQAGHLRVAFSSADVSTWP
jgi:aromatic amino acid aminotransferase I